MTIDRQSLTDFYARETLGAPENAVGFLLWRVMHRYQRAIDRALAPLDLTHLQFTTLAMVGWLCRKEEPTTQVELARHADIHVMQVSLMLKALEKKGLVARLPSSSDTRAKRVAITSAGLEALKVAMPLAIEIQQRMFGAAGEPGGALLTELRDVERRAE
ncbi:MarR family transcriptional regulator [Xanthobacter autotrophicus]|uniref:MarR family winged helix-turn-helix transcriptional regulator n=1 Tax=Xanthobacter autotrophicus TaxID=280 RepID=UPI00372985D5